VVAAKVYQICKEIRRDLDGISPRNLLIRLEARKIHGWGDGYPSDLEGSLPANTLKTISRARRNAKILEIRQRQA
jgi:hypothetical protein